MAKKQQSAGSMGFPTGGSKGDSRPVVRRRPVGGSKVKADKYGRPQPDSNTGK